MNGAMERKIAPMQGTGRQMLCLIPDLLTARVFIGTGILAALAKHCGGRFRIVPKADQFDVAYWGAAIQPEWVAPDSAFRGPDGWIERVASVVDAQLDRWFGFYPLALRFNLRYGFLSERLLPGSENWFLDVKRVGPLPRTDFWYRLMFRWMFSRTRFVPRALDRYFRENAGALFVTNIQRERITPFLVAAVRNRIPVIGYIASWDHPVGKGVVFPDCVLYIVQNEIMADALVRYHGIARAKIAVTGWPQIDNLAHVRGRDAYESELRRVGLDPNRPCILFTGNTERNSPYEKALLQRLLAWWEERGGASWASIVYRPHPKHTDWRKHHPEVRERDGFRIQDTSYHDHEIQALYLQHVDCVLTNAGTILLEAIACDRPCVCYLYDEGCPVGEGPYAEKNITGPHYVELVRSGAYHEARSFEGVAQGIEAALADPGALAAARRNICDLVLGPRDGASADRVVAAVTGMDAGVYD